MHYERKDQIGRPKKDDTLKKTARNKDDAGVRDAKRGRKQPKYRDQLREGEL